MQMSFWEQTRSLTRPFWVANVMEMIERLACYGVRVIIPIYRLLYRPGRRNRWAPLQSGGQGFHFYVVGRGAVSLAIFTGGLADRFG
jgi:hypothetical protein